MGRQPCSSGRRNVAASSAPLAPVSREPGRGWAAEGGGASGGRRLDASAPSSLPSSFSQDQQTPGRLGERRLPPLAESYDQTRTAGRDVHARPVASDRASVEPARSCRCAEGWRSSCLHDERRHPHSLPFADHSLPGAEQESSSLARRCPEAKPMGETRSVVVPIIMRGNPARLLNWIGLATSSSILSGGRVSETEPARETAS